MLGYESYLVEGQEHNWWGTQTVEGHRQGHKSWEPCVVEEEGHGG